MSADQRILVLRYRYIGDTLLTLPFLETLRQLNPTAQIDLYVGDDAAGLMAHCPFLDNVVAFEPKKLGFWKALEQIKVQHYDKVYVLKRSFSSALMVWMAGIPQRIGFATEGRSFLLTKAVPYKPHEQHEAQCYLDLLAGKSTYFPLSHPRVWPWLPLEAEESVQAVLPKKPGGEPWIVLHATSTNPAKTWPKAHFQQLAEALVERYGARLLFLGPPGDGAVVDAIVSGLSTGTRARVINLIGKTNLVESMAVLKQVDLIVANDSGMIHMAAAMDRPVIALFGPMDPGQWKPLSYDATIVMNETLPCRPCRMKITCQHQYPCMTELTPQKVLAACTASLKSWNGLKS